MKPYFIRLFLFLLFLSPLPMNAYAYFKGGVAVLGESVSSPMFAIGQRCGMGIAAMDISWSVAAGKREKVGIYTSPRFAILAYLNPCMENRLYIGGALSWGKIIDAPNQDNDHHKHHGNHRGT